MLRFGRSRAAARIFRPRWTVAVAALGASLAVAAPARAQFFSPEPWAMPPGAIHRAIVAQGFRVLVPPFRNGGVYVADVVNARGVQQRLIVDAYRGTIMQRYDIAQWQPHRRPGFSWPDSDDDGFPPAPRQYGDYDPDFSPPRPPGQIGRPFFEEEPITPAPRAQHTVRGSDDGREPSVIPGIGPGGPGEQLPPRPKRQAKPKAPTATVRATPLPPVQPPAEAAASTEPATTPPPTTDHAPGGQAHAAPAPHPPASESGKVEPTPGPALAGTPVAVVPSSAKPSSPPTTTAAPVVKPEKKKPQTPLNDVPAAPLD